MKIPYALKGKEIIHVSDVPSGLQRECLCPECGQALVAKKGAILIDHFSHQQGSDCGGGVESLLHILIKSVLLECTQLKLPGRVVPLSISASVLEVSINTFRADVLLNPGRSNALIVEVFVTHKTDNEKLRKISETGIEAIEIEIPQDAIFMTREDIRIKLETTSDWKKWLGFASENKEDLSHTSDPPKEISYQKARIKVFKALSDIPSWSSLYKNDVSLKKLHEECERELNCREPDANVLLLFADKISNFVAKEKAVPRLEVLVAPKTQIGRADYSKAKWGN